MNEAEAEADSMENRQSGESCNIQQFRKINHSSATSRSGLPPELVSIPIFDSYVCKVTKMLWLDKGFRDLPLSERKAAAFVSQARSCDCSGMSVYPT